MRLAPKLFFVSLLLAVCSFGAWAQKKDRVETTHKLTAEAACENLILGQINRAPKTVYPNEAKIKRIGGTVRLKVKVDEKGKSGAVERGEGAAILQNAATDALRKVKFKPTVCDGKAVGTVADFTFNFFPFVPASGYFTPTKTDELIDLKTDSAFYEAVSNLTENYRINFGYADKKFYADAPLTGGEFAHSLRLTLDLISERARNINKLPREAGLFYAYNPQKILTLNSIRTVKPDQPFYESIKKLLLEYDIAFTNERGEFDGNSYLTNDEVIDWWSRIFGEDSIPVNFSKTETDRLISRGEFALFWQESLQVLTYKVLP